MLLFDVIQRQHVDAWFIYYDLIINNTYSAWPILRGFHEKNFASPGIVN